MPGNPRDYVLDDAPLNVALLGPDEHRRKAVVAALSRRPDVQIHEFVAFPSRVEDLQQMLAQPYDVVILDADSESDYACALAESLCSSSRVYVMAYSAKADMKLAVNFMRAGVREFFTLPLDPAEISAALARATNRRVAPFLDERKPGKLFVFLGTKGGCGTTTLASNFALALAQETDKTTLLIDLGLPLGDVAINLGIVTEYSIATALQYPNRLDANLLSSIVVKHSSGLSVLTAPAELPDGPPTKDAVDKLVEVTREIYDFVVVDTGSRLDLMDSALFDESAIVLLIAQVGISELRNANRMILKYFQDRDDNLQVVLNRYKPSDLLFDDAQVAKVLNRPASWRIPDDYAAARRTRETATPMVLIDSPISQAIRHMAKTSAGVLSEKSEKKGFFRFLR
ncbi:MAG: AAA family ATPase [Terracidiphilus sp.]|jgi:pilus assembly protein CpaE